MVDEKKLTPTPAEIEVAQNLYATTFGKDAEQDNLMVEGRAQIEAMRRLYPAAYELTGKLKLDATMGFGVIDVGLPNDPTYAHVVMNPEEFLSLALQGEIALNEEGYPDYTGTERLRG
jgi:hypothetical protein